MLNSKKGTTILAENLIFIILNVLFLVILILFVTRQSSSAAIVEENYAKQIALLIDSAKPGMILKLNMEEPMQIAEKNGIAFEDIVKKEGNFIILRLDENSGHSYSFFNDVDISLDSINKPYYFFSINKKEEINQDE